MRENEAKERRSDGDGAGSRRARANRTRTGGAHETDVPLFHPAAARHKLPPMPHSCPFRRRPPFARPASVRTARVRFHVRPLLLVVLAAAAACDEQQAGSALPRDSGAPTVGLDGAPAVVAPPVAGLVGWNATDAGPALFVALAGTLGGPATGRDAYVVFPELTDSTLTTTTTFDLERVRGAQVDLFSRAGAAGTATLGPAVVPPRPTAEDECTGWPVARLTPVPAQGWTVALAAGRATAIALDSMDTLARPDSARRAADVARLASTLPGDTAGAFRGIPFAVRSARRFVPAPGVEALVAEVTRNVGEEARPRAEHILLVAERGGPTEKWRVVYSERVSDAEETVETREVLAALAVGAERVPTLVLSREYGDGGAYGLLERAASGAWRVRWGSAYAGC